MNRDLSNQKGISGGLLTIIIAAILVFAAGGYYLMHHSSKQTALRPATSTITKTPTAEKVSNTSSTISDIVGQGKNLECDWHIPVQSSNNPFGIGKLYTTANMGRSMISGNASGMTIEGNAIYKDGTAYSWVTVAGTTLGFKFDKEKMDKMNSEMTPQQKLQADQIRAKMIFSCKPWVPDESKFVLPSGVEFK